MKKNRVFISLTLAAAVLLLAFGHSSSATPLPYAVTQMPPEIVHTLGAIKTHELEGQRITMTLWSSQDAASRLENIQMAQAADADPGHTHIGVNVADPAPLFDAYLLRDGLAGNPYQVLATPESASQLLSAYGYTTISQ